MPKVLKNRKETAKELVIKSVALGMSLNAASKVIGMSSGAASSWYHEDPEFRKKVEEAEHEFMSRNLAKVSQATDSDWKAAAWLLERRKPDEWGRRERQDQHVTHENEQKVSIEVKWE